MKNIIVGTAGHVDHGKTSLIKALTGTDTDRLNEEKNRGITIELGFTNMPNDRDLGIGIIDVPGHEKFIKTMLSGIGSIDLAVLVVSGEEGVMPQTLEHFQIVKMLDVKAGVVVITKADLVDEEWLEVVKEDAADLVKGSFLEGAEIIAVSSHTGENIDVLKNKICALAEEIQEKNAENNALRIPVDRVFSVDGFGTVITGTLIEGSCKVGDDIEIYPEGKSSKIRNIQVHGNSVEQAFAGQRTAINLANIKKEELSKGDVIAAKGSLKTTPMIDVKISMFEKTSRGITNGARLHLYYGSDEVLCKGILLDAEVLMEGEEGYAQLRLEEEIAVKKGDRFILSFYSPIETIGGGVVLDANPQKHKRFKDHVLNSLKIKDKGSDKEILAQYILEESRYLTPYIEILNRISMPKSVGSRLTRQLIEEGTIIEIIPGKYLHIDFLDVIWDRAKTILETYHGDYSLSVGMLKEEFRKRLSDAMFLKDDKAVEGIINLLEEKGQIKTGNNAVSLIDFEVRYTAEQEKLRAIILAEYVNAKFEFPETDELLSKHNDKNIVKQIIEDLTSKGLLTKLTYQFYMDTECYNKGVEMVTNHIKANGKLTLAEFRDMANTSRKYGLAFLEALDNKKITVMIDDSRVLVA